MFGATQATIVCGSSVDMVGSEGEVEGVVRPLHTCDGCVGSRVVEWLIGTVSMAATSRSYENLVGHVSVVEGIVRPLHSPTGVWN
jgi:hypothetical protein